MKTIIGICLCALGIIVGLYVGVWICFIGGIVDIVNEINTQNRINGSLDAMTVAIGVVKIMFAWVFGWVAGLLLFLPGSAMITEQ
jgi:hypothetical protein